VVAIDVGGSALKAGIIGPDGVPTLSRVPSERERGPEAVLDTIVGTATKLLAEGDERRLDVVGIGVAVPGIVTDGIGVLSVTMGWRDLAVGDVLEQRLERPVTLAHDVRSGAVAEATFGAAAGVRSALFVPVGTGIAAAIVFGGAVLAGASSRAGEIGQILVDGQRTLEAVASARAIADRYAAAAGVPRGSVAADRVASLVRDGDTAAQSVWNDAVDALAGVLATTVAVLDFEVLVVGGGLARSGETLTRPLHAAMAARLPWRPVPEVVPARFGADAGFVGAGIEAWRAAGRDDLDLADALDRWIGETAG
jgi:glucokinase